ncbi:MAG: CpaF/VirB11 family protein, partial [Candidatus Methylomirabilis sp.]|nr:CpaF/VirB11 family protein [Deltaproteobacteria bacterium]
NIGRLVARHADGGGAGEVSIRDLVRDALRMRPDRIIVGEVRGPEALDMLQAMNTGHEGSMTTIHANNPVAALARLQFLVTLADAAMPDHLVRAQIGTSINLIVQLARFADGARRIVSIVELTGTMGEIIQRQELFTFHHQGLDEGGQIRGELRPTAMVPKFFSDLREKGLDIQFDLFG